MESYLGAIRKPHDAIKTHSIFHADSAAINNLHINLSLIIYIHNISVYSPNLSESSSISITFCHP